MGTSGAEPRDAAADRRLPDLRRVPLVARRAEVDRLHASLASLGEGTARHVAVIGDPGMGKTRLLREVDVPWRVLVGGATDTTRLRSFELVLNALGSDAGLRPSALEIATSLGRTADDGATIEAITGLLEDVAAREPVVLVLDDVHQTDPASVLALRHAASRLADLPVGIVVATRPVPDQHLVSALVDGLVENGGDRIDLAPLTPAEATELAAVVLGRRPSAEQLGDLIESSSGNPLLLLEFLAAPTAEPVSEAAAVDGPAHTDVPEALRKAVLHAVGHLPPPTVDMLRLAAVAGTRFQVSDLVRLTGRRAAQVYEALGPAVRAGVLVAPDDELSFAHDLVRDALYLDLPLAVRRSLHHELGDLLFRSGQQRSRAATHLLAGADVGDDDTATRLVEVADGTPNLEIEVDLLRAALEIMTPRHPLRERAAARAVACLGMLGRRDDADALAEEQAHTGNRAVVRAVRHGLIRAAAEAMDPVTVIRDVDVLRTLGVDDAQIAAELDAYEGFALIWTGEPARGAALARRVLSSAEAPPPVAAVFAHQALALSCLVDADPDGATRHAERAVALERATAADSVSHIFLGMSLMRGDDLAAAQDAFAAAYRSCTSRTHVSAAVLAQFSAGVCQLLGGELDAALVHADAGLAQASATGARAGLAVGFAIRAAGEIRAGRLDDAAASLTAGEAYLATSGAGADVFLWTRALHAVETGDLEAAFGHLTLAWDLLEPVRFAFSYQLLGVEIVRLAQALGPEADARARSVIATLEHGARRSGTTAARAAAAHAHALVTRDRAGLIAAAETHRLAGRHLAAEGAERDAQQLTRGRASEPQVASARRRRRPASGWGSLTEAETRVVPRVAEGLTSRAIAEELSVSVYTIDTHLRHIYQKLGIRSRAALAAAWAARPDEPA